MTTKLALKKTTADAVVPMDAGPVTPMSMLQAARAQGASLEQMQQLMEMNFKWEANEARKAYMEAVAKFKSAPIKITKDKANSQYGSRYTTIGNLVNTTNAELSKYGLNAHWDIDQSDGIKVTCILSHALGHSEKTSMNAPPDKSGSKNPIQEIKSTITYLKVATYEAITGVASTDDPGDNDGNSTVKLVTPAQIKALEKLIKDKKADKAAFLHHFGIDDAGIKGLPASKFGTAKRMLEAKK